MKFRTAIEQGSSKSVNAEIRERRIAKTVEQMSEGRV
jgi:hypothetical protein